MTKAELEKYENCYFNLYLKDGTDLRGYLSRLPEDPNCFCIDGHVFRVSHIKKIRFIDVTNMMKRFNLKTFEDLRKFREQVKSNRT